MPVANHSPHGFASDHSEHEFASIEVLSSASSEANADLWRGEKTAELVLAPIGEGNSPESLCGALSRTPVSLYLRIGQVRHAGLTPRP